MMAKNVQKLGIAALVVLLCMLGPVISAVAHPGDIVTVAGRSGSVGYAGDGGPATRAALNHPSGVCVDGAGNLYIADRENHRVRKVDASGVMTTVAGNGEGEAPSGDGGAATAASVPYPRDVCVDGSGNVYIASWGQVRKVDAAGVITTVAGGGSTEPENGVAATDATLGLVTSVCVGGTGNLYVGAANWVWKVDASGTLSWVARLGEVTDIVVDDLGQVYMARDGRVYRRNAWTGDLDVVAGTDGDGTPPGEGVLAVNVELGHHPVSIAVDASDNLYLTDRTTRRVWKVDGEGVMSVVAGAYPGGGPLGEGGPATDANLGVLQDICLDGSGNLYIAVAGRTNNSARDNHRVWKVGGVAASPVGPTISVFLRGAAGSKGDDVTVSAEVKSAMGVAGGRFTISYDASRLSIPSADRVALTDLTQGFSLSANTGVPGQITVGLISATGIPAGAGPLFTVTLSVKSDAPEGPTPLRFLDVALRSESVPLPVIARGGTVTVGLEGLLGDVNADGVVGFGDAILVLKHAVGLVSLSDAQRISGDVNSDGSTDLGDAILILRFDVGLIASLSKPAAKLVDRSSTPVPVPVDLLRVEDLTDGSRALRVGFAIPEGVAGGALTLSYGAHLGLAHGAQLEGLGPGALAAVNTDAVGQVRAGFLEVDGASTHGQVVLQVLLPKAEPGDPLLLNLVGDFYDALGVKLGAVRLSDEVRALPTEYGLFQNYPNPFNPATTICYDLPHAGYVVVGVYTVTGQLVRRLVVEHAEAGTYRVTWDGRDALGRPASSGVYLYRLTSGTFSETRRMLLLK